MFIPQFAVKASLVAKYGLEGLRSIVLSHMPLLPQMVRDKTLTFLCSDFQEITPSDCLGELSIQWISDIVTITL